MMVANDDFNAPVSYAEYVHRCAKDEREPPRLFSSPVDTIVVYELQAHLQHRL